MYLHKQQSTDGQVLCSGVGSQLKMSTVLVAHLTHVLTKMLILSWIWQWKIEDWLQDMLLSVLRHQLEQHVVLFQMFGLQQNMRTLGAKNVDCWNHAYPNANFQSQHQTVHSRSCQISSSICDYGQDMGSSLWPVNQIIVYAVETPHFTSSSQVSQDHLSQQNYGVCILGQWMSSDGWLLRAREDCHRCVLCWVSSQIARSNQEKAPRKVDGRSAASPRQCTNAHLRCCHHRYPWVWLRTPHSPYSPDLAPSDFHLFRNLKELLRGRAFEDDNAVIMAINEWIEERNKIYSCKAKTNWNRDGKSAWLSEETNLRNNEMILMCVDFLCVFLITCRTTLVANIDSV